MNLVNGSGNRERGQIQFQFSYIGKGVCTDLVMHFWNIWMISRNLLRSFECSRHYSEYRSWRRRHLSSNLGTPSRSLSSLHCSPRYQCRRWASSEGYEARERYTSRSFCGLHWCCGSFPPRAYGAHSPAGPSGYPFQSKHIESSWVLDNITGDARMMDVQYHGDTCEEAFREDG